MADSEKTGWDKKAGHPMQSWAWGEFRKEMGNGISRVAGEQNYQIIWSKLYFLPRWFGYIPMGPVPTDKDIKLLGDEAVKNKAVGVRMEPLAMKGVSVPKELVAGRHLFKKQTYWVNLQKSEEELLAEMHPKARYNIKIAQRHEVEVSEDNSEAAVEAFLKLMFDETAKRQGFYAHNKNYFRKMWRILGPAGIESVFTAKLQGKIVSAWIIYRWKEFIYYVYGANSLEHREAMAPTALMWELIKKGKSGGYKQLDLWGTEEGKGFGRFKEQFGGQLIEQAGSYDLPVKRYEYPLFRLSEEVRWKILRAIK